MAREAKETVRERILAAAEKRLWHFGIKKTTIDEIAEDADVGKGTVYLHFESKEEIAIAIIRQYKEQILREQITVAGAIDVPVLERLKKVLSIAIERPHEYCAKSPIALELIATVRPQLVNRLVDVFDKELALISGLIEEGNRTGVMHVAEPLEAATLLKRATLIYLPASVCGAVDNPQGEAEKLVELVYKGLR